MVKEPRPGRVKTRLGAEIGMTRAAWWYRHQVARLLRRLQDPRWTIVLAVAPDRDGLMSRVWPANVARLPQGDGDLGQRMARMLRATPGPTVLIGSDIPGIAPQHIARAFRALGNAPSVVGPAPDGGFWLVGLRHPRNAPKHLFGNVRWSHPETCADTLPTLPQPVALVDPLSDVDEAEDLRR
ncbi:MAG: TIGR04282 family arsenosugar biosynthesis glycosyltransferase [Pseudomonadota bacterium]